jgi:streptomycin 6-kinase
MAWRGATPEGAAWLQALPRLAEESARLWSLRLGDAFPASNLSLVVRAETDDGTRVVLKLAFPGDDDAEAAALAFWAGEGAVRLLDRDTKRGALLLEACAPGGDLSSVAEREAFTVAARLLLRLWHPPPASHPFPTLAARLEPWAASLSVEERLREEALAAVRELAATQADPIVLHGDFHSANVLAAAREPWLAIDPVPLVGEPAFDAASLLRDRGWPLTAESLRWRLDTLSGELGLDRERVRRWGIVQALWWGVSVDKAEEDLLETARLLSASS